MKSSKLVLFILGVTAVVGVGYFILQKGSEEPAAPFTSVEVQKVEVGGPAPDVSLTDFSGSTTKLSEYKGKAVVLDFWAAWCPFCVEEMVELEKAYQANREKLVMIGIHRTATERQDVGQKFANAQGVSYPLVVDPQDTLYRAFSTGLQAMPLAVFIDEEGVVSDIKFGPKTADEITQKVKVLLGE